MMNSRCQFMSFCNCPPSNTPFVFVFVFPNFSYFEILCLIMLVES